MEQIKIALLSTLIVIILIPLIGFIINLIQRGIYFLFSLFLGQLFAYYIIQVWLTFPGAIFHELCHFIILTLTGAKARIVNLFKPSLDGTLGSVEYYSRGGILLKSLQHSLGSSAPTFIGLFVLSFSVIKIYPNLTVIWQYIIFWYLWISILLHIDMSFADMINYLRGLAVLIIPIFLIFFFAKIDLIAIISQYLKLDFWKTFVPIKLLKNCLFFAKSI